MKSEIQPYFEQATSNFENSYSILTLYLNISRYVPSSLTHGLKDKFLVNTFFSGPMANVKDSAI
jgi:hypothetical protein